MATLAMAFDLFARDNASPTFARVGSAATAAAASVKRASLEMTAAADAEANAAGRVRVAQLKLEEVRAKGTASAAQLARAEEQVALAERNQVRATAESTAATQRYAAAQTEAGVAAKKSRFHIDGLMKVFAAVAVIDAGKHMVTMAGDFQKSTNVLMTAANETSAGLKVVRNGLLDLTASTGTPLHELTDGMYVIEKAGIHGARGLHVLEAAAKGAKEEGASLASVTNAMTSVMQSYHLPASKAVAVMDEMKTAAGESKTTMEEFAASLSTVLPIASANHMSFAKVAGAMATLTQHGTSAKDATHELAASIRMLASPSMVAIKEMGQLGVNSQDVSQKLGQRGVAGTMNYLSETVLRKMGPAGKVLLDTFNRSTSAGADATQMMKNMAPATRQLAEQYARGAITQKDWTSALKDMTPQQASLAKQFAVVENKAKGFNAAIRAGMPGSQTYSDAMKKMTGGAIGLNTALQLTGESTAGTTERVKRVADAYKHAGKEVSGWASTQQTFNQQMAEFRGHMDRIGIQIGTALIPKLQDAAIGLSHVLDFASRNSGTLIPLAKGIGAVALALKAWSLAAKAAAKWNTIVAISAGRAAPMIGAETAAATAGAGAAGAGAAAGGAGAAEGAAVGAGGAGLAAGGRAVAMKGAMAAALAYAGAQVAQAVGSWASHLGGRGNEKGVLSDFQKQRGGVGNFFLGSGATFQNAAKVALGRNSLAERADQKVAGFLGGDGTTKALSNVDKLDAAIVRLTKLHPEQGQRAFRDALDKSGLSAADFAKVLPKASAAVQALGTYFTQNKPKLDFSATLEKSGQSTRQFISELKRLPAQVVTKIGTPGAIKSLKDVVGLQKQYGLTPKQVISVIAASGVKLTKASIMDLQHQYHLTPKQVETLMVLRNEQALHNTAATQLAYSHVPHTVKTEAQFNATKAKNDTRTYQEYVNDRLAQIKRNIQVDISISRASQRIVNAAQAGNNRNHVGTQFATGGPVSGPGTGTSDSIPALLSNGEHVWTAKEVAKAGGHAAVEAMRKGILRRAMGGPIGTTTVTPVTHGHRFGVGDVNAYYASMAHNAGAALTRKYAPILAAMSSSGPAGSGVARWAPTVLKVLSMFGFGPSWLSAGLHRIAVESGGNPRAINLSDSNAKAGHPSQGLLQTIPSTFAAYAGPYRSLGINNGLASIYAGVNYALHRYNVPFVGGNQGYDQGGIANGVGLMPKMTLKPERVLSPKQTQSFDRLVTLLERNGTGSSMPAVHVDTINTYDPEAAAAAIRREQMKVLALMRTP